MQLWLADEFAEAIRSTVVQRKTLAGPDLSCEAVHLTLHDAREAVVSSISGWHQALLIRLERQGHGRLERTRACLVDLSELAPMVDEALDTGDVVSIVDPTVMGGCAFDLDREGGSEPKGTVELLVTGWGEHEAMIEPLAERLGGVVFRQGQTAEDYRKEHPGRGSPR